MFEQLKAPNLSVVGQAGLCLVYVREVFGVGPKYPTATSAWENAEFKHAGDAAPTDVSVPVWFSWETDGHVAVSVPGKGIYTTTAQGDKVFGNVEELAQFIGGSYLGWSEDVDGVRVVEPAPEPAPVPAPAPGTTSIKINSGTWYVRTAPDTEAAPETGFAEGGQTYPATILSSGWAEISFRARIGYVGPAAFKVI